MSMICGGDGSNPNGNNDLEDINEKYRNGLINTAAYIALLEKFKLPIEEIHKLVDENRPNRLWETRNDCD